MQTILSKIKIKKQIYLIFIPIIVIPILFVGSFLTSWCLKILYDQSYTQLESDNLRVKSIIFDATLNLYNISEDLISDKTLAQILKNDYPTLENGIEACTSYLRLHNYLSTNTSISSICVYTTNPTIGNSKFIKPLTTKQEKIWLEQVTIPSSFFWESSQPENTLNTRTSPELTLVRSFPLARSDYPAILVIKMSTNYLKNRIQNNKLFTALSVNKDPIFFCTIRTKQGTDQEVPIDYNNNYYQLSGTINYDGKKRLSHISSLIPYMSTDCIYITTLDFNAIPSITKIGMICCLIILISIIFPLIVIVFFSKYLSSRINTLRTAMHNARTGNYDIINTFKGDDELSDTFSDLKIVINHVKEKESNIYKAQIKEQELINQQQKIEYKLLASQINPHFIYNTLETIRMMALSEGNKDVATATKLLGKSMHYVLENTGSTSTTLKKELDYIDVYLTIQKLRFNDRVNYTLDICEQLLSQDYEILPLLIQPIVENALVHGLKEVENDGHINITISNVNNELLSINIVDNGRGMTPEELSLLYEKLKEPTKMTTSNIGLYNINQRIKLFYGSSYGMTINSSLEEGTSVHLSLPLIPTTTT